jgi:putative transcriptional regulator
MEGIDKKRGVSKSQLLLADPFLLDQNFKRTVILICSHEDKLGSVGFILNRKLDLKLNELISDFPEFDVPVFYGGPVSTETIHYVHDCGSILDGSEEIGEGIYWGGNFDKLKFLISSELIRPHNIRFYLGYSGWSAMQLKDELEYGSWIISDMHPNYILKSKPEILWNEVMKRKGNSFSVIAEIPDSFYLN